MKQNLQFSCFTAHALQLCFYWVFFSYYRIKDKPQENNTIAFYTFFYDFYMQLLMMLLLLLLFFLFIIHYYSNSFMCVRVLVYVCEYTLTRDFPTRRPCHPVKILSQMEKRKENYLKSMYVCVSEYMFGCIICVLLLQ